MTRKTRFKAEAAAVTFSNPFEVNAAIEQIGHAQRERERIETAMNDELARVRAGYEDQAAPHAEVIRVMRHAVQVWCEGNRAELTRAGKKTYAFAAGEVSWRMRPAKVTVRGEGIVIATLKKLGLERWIRTKEELDKSAILSDPDAANLVEGVAGLTVSQGEDFVIRPFETKIEEVQ